MADSHQMLSGYFLNTIVDGVTWRSTTGSAGWLLIQQRLAVGLLLFADLMWAKNEALSCLAVCFRAAGACCFGGTYWADAG